MGKPRVLILGGGFGGMYAVLKFEHMLARVATWTSTTTTFFSSPQCCTKSRRAISISQYRQPNPQVVMSRDLLPGRHRIHRPGEYVSRPVAWGRGTLPFATPRSPGAGHRVNHELLPPTWLGRPRPQDEIVSVPAGQLRSTS